MTNTTAMFRCSVNLLVPVLLLTAACIHAHSQSGLDSSGIPQASSTFPVEHGVVNLNNGALHLELPIVNYAQRGNVSLSATLNYDSNIWKINKDSSLDSSDWYPNGGTPSGDSATGGWYVSYHPTNQSINAVQWAGIPCQGGQYGAYIYSAFSWMDQSGSTHIFPATVIPSGCTGVDGNTYTTTTTASAYATDGSGYYGTANYLASNGGLAINIYDRAGSLVGSNSLPGSAGTPTVGVTPLSNGPIVPIDRNGNSPVYASPAILDTMGRNLVNDTGIVTVAGVGTVEYINVPVAGGHTATYTINYTTIPVSTSFGYPQVNDVSGVSMTVVSSVVLPDGSSYQFGYNANSYGELTGMTLPHGGHVGFTYMTAPSVAGGLPTRWVQSHTGSDGATNFSWSQAQSSPYSQAGSSCQLVMNQVTTASAKNTYKFSNCNNTILLQEVDHGSATSSAIDAVDLYSYDTSNPCPTLGSATVYHIGCTGLQWMNITGKTTVLPSTSGSGTSIVKDIQYTYGTPGSGVPTSTKQWDYYSGSPTSLPDSPPGLPARETDTTLGYSVNGALFPTVVSTKDATGTVVSTTSYTYDEPAYLSSTTSTAPNHSNGLVAGNRGNLTTVTKCCGWNGTSNVVLTSHAWYDDAGTVLETQDANGYTATLSAHDPTDTFPTVITLPSTQAPNGAAVSHVINQTYDTNSGQISSITDENQQTTSYTFDALGRPYQITTSNAGSPVTRQTMTYPSPNEMDLAVLQSTGKVLSSSSILDSYGRLSKTLQAGVSSETSYDSQGRIYSVTNAHASTPSSTDGTTYYGHDELGRLTSMTMPNGYSTTYVYDQNGVTITDPLSHSRQMWSDAFGNTTSVLEPDGTGALSFKTLYTYNWQNKLSKALQQGGTTDTTQWRARTFSYDSLGRLTTQTTPEAGTVSYGYDNNGNLTLKRNQNTTNNTIQYFYDALNRKTSEVIAGGPTYSYTYDAQDSSGDTFGKGLLTSASNGTNVQTLWQHDALGRTISSAYCLPSDCTFSYKVQSSFDFQGNQTSLTYPDGRQLQWSYDQTNRPISETYSQWGATSVNTAYISSIAYTPTGSVQQATLGNGVQLAATYDSVANLSSLVYVANGSPIVQKTYVWDKNASNLKTITDTASGRVQSYQYDQLDRILSFSDSGTTNSACNVNLPNVPAASQSYATDPWGNMTSSGTDAFTSIINANNQIQALPYDSTGNQGNDGADQYHYRADGLMTDSNGTTYTYDALGYRVRKDGSSSNEYIYYGGQLLAMRNPSTGVWTDRIYGPMGALATVPGTQSGLPAYRATDHLGSLSYTLDSTGTITGSSSVLPYGQSTSNTLGDTFTFTDHERDAENQTDATLYRHYASFQGRWLSPDPSNASYNVLDPQSLNRYAYLSNRPTAKVDRLGLDGDDDDDDDDDDDGWDNFWNSIGGWFGFGSGGDGGSANYFAGIPSPASGGLSGTTQPDGGMPYIMASFYYNGATGVSSGSWAINDAAPGLDRDGIATVLNAISSIFSPTVVHAQAPVPETDSDAFEKGPEAPLIEPMNEVELRERIQIGCPGCFNGNGEGPLNADDAKNFEVYKPVKPDKSIRAFRAYGGRAGIEGQNGTYYSVLPAEGSPEAIRQLYAILPEWGNALSDFTDVCIPAGTQMYIGPAAQQTSTNGITYRGGGLQIFVPK